MPAETVVGGDWNCALRLYHDRFIDGRQSTAANKSPRLSQLLRKAQLLDGIDTLEHDEVDFAREPSEHYSYWAGRHAARLDRWYLSRPLWSTVQWVAATLPIRASDHQAVTLYLASSTTQARARPLAIQPSGKIRDLSGAPAHKSGA